MKTMKWLKKLGAGLLSVALLGALAVPVFAADKANPSRPDPNKTGAITVTKIKYETKPNIGGTGQALSDAEIAKLGTRVPNIEFSLYRVLNDADVTAASVPADFVVNGVPNSKVTLVSSQKTDAKGEIKWGGAATAAGDPGNLPQGYYVLVEQQDLTGTAVEGYNRAVDTIITLPYGVTTTGKNDNNNWNFDIHVYPKNWKDSGPIDKKVTGLDANGNLQNNFVKGDKIQYLLTARYDADLLKYPAGTTPNRTITLNDYWPSVVTFDSSVVSVSLIGGGAGGTDVRKLTSSEYTMTGPTTLTTDEAKSYPASDGKYTFVFKEDIVSLLGPEKTAGKFFQIAIELGGTVNDKAVAVVPPAENSIIKNTMNGDYNGNNIPDKDQDSKRGGIVIDKITNDSPAQKLGGASFNLYESLSDIEYGADGAALGQGKPMKDAAGNVLTVTTDSNGYGEFVGMELPTTGSKEFYLFESNVPDGFIRQNKVYKVTLSRFDSTGKENPDGKLYTITITNQREGTNPPSDDSDVVPDPDKNKPMFALPMTGGAGTVMFIVVGLGLMGGAIAIMIRNKNKNRA